MSDYNGWSNYETWCVNLWLSNDEGLYIAVTELVAETMALSEAAETSAAYEVAEALHAFVEDLPDYRGVREEASFVSDLLGAALSEVDWREIAEAWITGLVANS